MSDTLKDKFFAQSFWDDLAANLTGIVPDFDGKAFQQRVCDANWEHLALKQRVRKVAVALRPYLPAHYPEAVGKLVDLSELLLQRAAGEIGFAYLWIPDFIEEFGLEHLGASVAAMPTVTQVMSCEFAVRPFIDRHPDQMLATLYEWAAHPNEHVRRLASEGCRPRLPWGRALTFLKRDPKPILPILARLKADPSEYVRRSVANNLNDISKDHPALVLEIAADWIGQSSATDRLLKHALRGLLKAGNREAMDLFGFETVSGVSVRNLLPQARVTIGEDWVFSFELEVATEQRLRLEFGIDYRKANGKANRKIFQLKEDNFKAGKHAFTKRHSFLERTTRKHHRGAHAIAVLVNGTELGLAPFWVD